jgi:transposase
VGDSIEIPLGLDDIEVIEAVQVESQLEVRVRSTRRLCCVRCGSVDVIGHGRNDRRIRDVPCGLSVVLIWEQRRLSCRDCGATSRERHPMVDGAKRATVRLRRRLFDEAMQRPFTEVAGAYGVSDWRVLDAFDDHAQAELAARCLPPPRVLALDESSYQRGFRYATVLFAPELRLALDMVMGRHRGSAAALLETLDPQAKAGIDAVVIDLHWPFRKAIEATLPDAAIRGGPLPCPARRGQGRPQGADAAESSARARGALVGQADARPARAPRQPQRVVGALGLLASLAAPRGHRPRRARRVLLAPS